MNFDPIANLTITAVTSANRITTRAAGSRTGREQWAFVFKTNGCTQYTVNGRTLLSDNHHPIILPKGCSYHWRSIHPGESIIINFSADVTLTEPISFSISDNKPLISAIQQIERSLNRQEITCQMECKAQLYGILFLLIRSMQKEYISKEKSSLIHPAIRYMEEHYSDPGICNEALAKLCGTSTVYFRKVFHNVYGVSPIKYLQEFRINKAKSILISDYDSIAQVAESIGYSNIYHFSKMFKQYTGMSPTQFANSPQQKEPTESP